MGGDIFMTKEDIIDGNRELALFMGYTYYPHPNKPSGWIKGNYQGKNSESYLGRTSSEIRYYNNFHELVKVVESIECIYDEFHGYFGVNIYSNSCTIQGTKLNIEKGHYAYFSDSYGDTKLQATWIACVTFVRWYKENYGERATN